MEQANSCMVHNLSKQFIVIHLVKANLLYMSV